MGERVPYIEFKQVLGSGKRCKETGLVAKYCRTVIVQCFRVHATRDWIAHRTVTP